MSGWLAEGEGDSRRGRLTRCKIYRPMPRSHAHATQQVSIRSLREHRAAHRLQQLRRRGGMDPVGRGGELALCLQRFHRRAQQTEMHSESMPHPRCAVAGLTCRRGGERRSDWAKKSAGRPSLLAVTLETASSHACLAVTLSSCCCLPRVSAGYPALCPSLLPHCESLPAATLRTPSLHQPPSSSSSKQPCSQVAWRDGSRATQCAVRRGIGTLLRHSDRRIPSALTRTC